MCRKWLLAIWPVALEAQNGCAALKSPLNIGHQRQWSISVERLRCHPQACNEKKLQLAIESNNVYVK
eukprot:COSAG01_NODE_1745_length_9351_cov_206.635470_6_plen_67_part_00